MSGKIRSSRGNETLISFRGTGSQSLVTSTATSAGLRHWPFLVAALIAFWFSVSLQAGDTPKYGGEMRLAVPTELPSFDPARCYITPGINLVRLCYRGLVDYDDGINIVPALATSWDLRAKTNYLFHLDPSARFENGRTITTADYIYSIERTLSGPMSCPASFLYTSIAGMEEYRDGKAPHIAGLSAPSEFELAITLKRTDPTFLYKLAMPFMSPVCREIVEKPGASLEFISAGAGPMRVRYYHRGSELLLERSSVKNPRTDVYVDRIRILIGGSETVHQMMFERGELEIANLAEGLDMTQAVRVEQTPALARYLEKIPFGDVWFVALNCELPPFTDKRVRQAFNFGINKARLVAKTHGMEIAVPGLIPPSLPAYNTNLTGYSYSPDKARALLREAGLENGFTTTLWVNNFAHKFLTFAEMMREDLQAIGITLDIKVVSAVALIEAAGTRKTVPCSLSGWIQDYPDPSSFFEVVRGRNISDRDCQNLSFYQNKDLDALLDQADDVLDPVERIALMRKAEKIVVEDAPLFFFDSTLQFCLHQPWLKGPALHPVWVMAFERMWIDR